MFGRATRHRLEEAEFDAFLLRYERDHWKDLHKKLARQWRADRDQIVRLRRELDSVRNHVPLQGVVFNGDVL